MKINMAVAVQIQNTLGELVNTKMNIKTSYKIMKFLKSIEQERSFFDSKMKEIIEEFGEKKEDGTPNIMENGNISIIKGKEMECAEAMKELEALEIEIPDTKFSLEELDELELSPREIFSLDPIIE